MNRIKERKSNLELLRIFSMILIILYHYLLYSGFEFGRDITVNKLITQIICFGGKVGVNCFVLISGYFLIDSKFKWKKVFKIIIESFTYSMIILLIAYIFKFDNLNAKNIIKSIFPTTFSMYWFISVYIVLYVLSPYINKLFDILSKKEVIKLIGILVFISIASITPVFIYVIKKVSSILWFITLYLIGAYIKRYPNKYFNDKRISLCMILISYLLIVLSIVILDFFALLYPVVEGKEMYYVWMNSIFVLVNSVSLFLFFKELDIKCNKCINSIASTMFGVYIMHDNVFMRRFIWRKVVCGFAYQDSAFLIVNAFIGLLGVLIVGIVIDFIRQIFIEKYQMKLLDFSCEFFKKKFSRLNVKVNKFIDEEL